MRKHAAWLFRAGCFCLTFMLVVAAPVLAKEGEEKLPPYDIQGLEHGQTWVPWVFAFLFAASCIMLAVKNPHRSSTGGQ